jgi:hypothetical protein
MTDLALLSHDTLKRGIMETIVYESQWLRYLPFISITGNAYLYNWETALAGANFYVPGDQWVESSPTWTQRTASLVALGGDADVDKFMQQTRNQQDLKATVIELKAKAVGYAFDEFAVMGRTSSIARYTNGKAFKGILQLIAEAESTTTTDLDSVNNSQVVAAGATTAILTIDMLDELIDKVKPKATHLIMNRRMLRKLKSLARAAGNNLEVDTRKLGMPVTMYGEQIILVDDWSPENIQDGSASVINIAAYNNTTYNDSGYNNSVIIAARFGEDGVCGLENGGIQVEELGTVFDHDATRTRIKWYCGLAMFSKLSAAALINVATA